MSPRRKVESTMRKTIAIFILAGCIHENEPDAMPPPLTTGPSTVTNISGTGDTGDSSSTGTCDPSYAQYRCTGFVAGVYKHPTVESYTFLNLNGEDYYTCLDFDTDPDLQQCEFFAGDFFDFDSNSLSEEQKDFRDLILAGCASDCETKVANEEPGYNDDSFPTSINVSGIVWTRQDIACVFEHNPDGCTANTCGAAYNPTSGEGCEFINNTPVLSPAQVEENGPCQGEEESPEQCAEEQWCTNWDPVRWTKHWTSGGLLYSTIDDDFWEQIFGDYDVINCDVGRYKQHDQAPGGPAEWWDWKTLVAGDFFYEIGLRTNDKNTKIKIGSTWYPLDTDPHMWSAMDALNGATSFQLQVTRGTLTKTINVSIVACPFGGC